MSDLFKDVADKAIAGQPLSDEDIRSLVEADGLKLFEMAQQAQRVKVHYFEGKAGLCAIINAKSGACSEDCSFCAQSSHFESPAPEHDFIDVDKIIEAAQVMGEAGASRFSVVTSGKNLSQADFQRLLEATQAITDLGLLADASVGMLSRERLLALKDAGLSGYHHNLETSRSFFPNICTTHDYDEDVQVVRDAVEVGLYVCSGGLFGMGETWEDRVELAQELKGLGVQSVPVNFLHPIPGTPLADRPVMSKNEATKIVSLLRFLLPEKHIRVCGGRLTVFGDKDKRRVLMSGASGIMIGDYLTVKGGSVASDRTDLFNMAMTPETPQDAK